MLSQSLATERAPVWWCSFACARAERPRFGWHYLSNATCLIQHPVLYASFIVSIIILIDVPTCSSCLKKACVGQAVLDKWFLLSDVMIAWALVPEGAKARSSPIAAANDTRLQSQKTHCLCHRVFSLVGWWHGWLCICLLIYIYIYI